jgi:hypothetical protein
VDRIIDAALFDSVVRALIPVLLAALGGMICERAGVFQISLEGLMLVGAFAAVAGSFFAGSATVGVLVAVVAGAACRWCSRSAPSPGNGDPIVLGVAINLLALGLTSFLITQLFGVRGTFQDPGIAGMPRIALPWLSEIPILGSSVPSDRGRVRGVAVGAPAVGAAVPVPRLGPGCVGSASGRRRPDVRGRPDPYQVPRRRRLRRDVRAWPVRSCRWATCCSSRRTCPRGGAGSRSWP